ncbi:MAG: UDP-N-acetylmuramoyl-tripeptide--D-alanyl-D-alanine ligase [Acidimicrobiales bacterium]
MQFRASDIASATGGALLGDDVAVDGAAVDSRLVAGGELFVPIVAERDGHDFVPAAVAAGAAAYLTARGIVEEVAVPAVVVDDTGRALLELGSAARSRLDASVIGITGSVGKTTVKDLTVAALGGARHVAASPRSFNNELGVPLTLVNARADTEVAVIEMGARGAGHIAVLCDVARPLVGVVTAVVAAHTEMFGSVEEVAAAKGELVEALPRDGTAVLNADNPLVLAMAERSVASVLTFGATVSADVSAEAVTLDDRLRASFRLRSPWGTAHVTLPVSGEHQVANALAAAGAALASGAAIEAVAAGLAATTLSPWRMELHRTASGAVVLNDAYNANPTSMEAALRSLAALAAGRRVAVLGIMAELGSASSAEHRRIAALAAELGIRIVAVATNQYGIEFVGGVDEAVAAVGPVGEGDAVLVKGSRVAGLERVAQALLAAP